MKKHEKNGTKEETDFYRFAYGNLFFVDIGTGSGRDKKQNFHKSKRN